MDDQNVQLIMQSDEPAKLKRRKLMIECGAKKNGAEVGVSPGFYVALDVFTFLSQYIWLIS